MYLVVLQHEMYVNIMHSRQICVLTMPRVHMYILSSPVIWGDMSTAVPGVTGLWSGVVDDGVLTATPPPPDPTS